MKILQKSYNTLRVVSSEMIANAEVGDVRSCIACAPVMFMLFKDHYNYLGGKNYVNRDRFVLGDISLTPLYYATMHLFGLGYTVEELKEFGKNENIPVTPSAKNPNVDVSVSSKGQGIPTAVGLALASLGLSSKFNAQRYNIISNYTYCFVSVSNLEEGISQEAMAFAGSMRLSRLIVFCNYIEKQSHGENLAKKYKAMGWNVITVFNPNSTFLFNLAMSKAKLSLKPTLILLRNVLNKEFPGLNKRVLDKNEVEKLKADLNLSGEYHFDNDILQYSARSTRRLKVDYHKWEKKTVIYRNTHTKLSEELNEYFVCPKLNVTKEIKQEMQDSNDFGKANNLIFQYLLKNCKCIMSASIKEKLLPKTDSEERRIFSKNNYRAQNLVFGNRENAMAEICSGISAYFGAPTYVYAPVCLLGQMLSGIEHSSRTKLPVLYMFYQSGSCVNQQKTNIELYGQLEWLKNVQNLDIYQPATPTELLACYANVYESERTACMVMPLNVYDKIESDYDGAKHGAYIMSQDKVKNDITFISSGREIYVATALKKLYNDAGKSVKIVSLPSWTKFNEQTEKYKSSIIDIQKENVVAISTSKNLNVYTAELNKFNYININDFTSTPELITDEVILKIFNVLETNNKDK